MARKWLPGARIPTIIAENRSAGRGASIYGHPGARGGPNWPEVRPTSFLKHRCFSLISIIYFSNLKLLVIRCWGYSAEPNSGEKMIFLWVLVPSLLPNQGSAEYGGGGGTGGGAPAQSPRKSIGFWRGRCGLPMNS